MPKSSATYWPFGGDQDVARVHVGVEEAVAKHLREENLHARARQLLDVDALLAQRRDLRDRRAVHALHHHHLGRAVVPVHLRHQQQRRVREIAAQLARVGRLAHQIEFVVEVLGELRDDFVRAQALAVGPQKFDQARAGIEQRDVVPDDLGECRAAVS